MNWVVQTILSALGLTLALNLIIMLIFRITNRKKDEE